MVECRSCGASIGQDSYEYCTNCGVRLINSTDAPTVRIPTQVDQHAIESARKALFEISSFKEYEFDARFDRLVDWITMNHPQEILPFLLRLLGRAKLALGTNAPLIEGLTLLIAVDKDDPPSGYQVLKSRGLL